MGSDMLCCMLHRRHCTFLFIDITRNSPPVSEWRLSLQSPWHRAIDLWSNNDNDVPEGVTLRLLISVQCENNLVVLCKKAFDDCCDCRSGLFNCCNHTRVVLAIWFRHVWCACQVGRVVWLYSLFSFIVQDVAKVITYRLLAYFEVVLPIESYDTEYACAHLEAELHGASRSSDALEHHTTQTDRIIDIEPGIKPIMT